MNGHNEPGEHQAYLGDGVYVSIERGMVKLYIHDGFRTTSRIYLEDVVLTAFGRWLRVTGIKL